MFTKNASTDVHERHKGDYVWTKNEVACLCLHAQQEGCCEVLIGNTETTTDEGQTGQLSKKRNLTKREMSEEKERSASSIT